VSFQYKIIKDKIPELYNLANINYQSTLVRMARDVFMKVGGKYNATSYWTERPKIADYMKLKLNEELNKAYVSIEGLQILRIDLPKSYEDSIVATQVEVQKTNMRIFEQQAELIRQNIGVLISQAQQKIRITEATATAEAYRIKQYATAQATQNTIDTEASVFSDAMNKIGVKDKELVDYIYYTSLMSKNDANLLVGLQNTIVNLGSTNQPVAPVNQATNNSINGQNKQ
jgi:ribosomal protein L24